MIAFAALVEALLFAPSDSARTAQLRRYLATTPDPDRGYGLAAVTGQLTFTPAKPALLRDLVARLDPVLFALSHDFVGESAETVALMWPGRPANAPPPSLAEVVATMPAADLPALLPGWLDACPPGARVALLKLVTGSQRASVPAGLARVALADVSAGRATVAMIEEVWHAQTPPYAALFAWLEGRAPPPAPTGGPIFRPMDQATPLEDADLATLDPATLRAEWQWDGIRVQLAAGPAGRRLFSHDAEDISAAFPDLIAAMAFSGVLDGTLLVVRDGVVAPHADLRPRLGRKTATAKLQRDFPVAVRLHDILFDGEEDLRQVPFDTRRQRLEEWFARARPPRMDLARPLPFATRADLAALRADITDPAITGLMLRRGDAAKGGCWAWQRPPQTIDAVLMYAQRGQGDQASFHAECTFGLWRQDGVLVPIGKAACGLGVTDLESLDRWVREHTTQRFGPVREVSPGLVLTIAFDAVEPSPRHKSGLALRAPRIAGIRGEMPAGDAGRLETLLRLPGIIPA